MKKAFSLIELILAIVVIAIAIAALPRIVSQTQRSSAMALKQELLFHSKSMLSNVLNYPWDSQAFETECTLKGGDPGCGNTNYIRLPIYDIPSAGESDDKRPGIVNTSGARSYDSRKPSTTKFEATPSSNFRSVSFGEYILNSKRLNDIDDFDDYEIDGFTATDNFNRGDFLNDANLKVNVFYVSDSLIKGNYRDSEEIEIEFKKEKNSAISNIKAIEIITKDKSKNDTSLEIKMYGYSFNIGDSPNIPRK